MNNAGNSRFDTVLKMLLIAFVSLLAFSSGVYFGREMTENDYKLKALESDFQGSRANTAAVEKAQDYTTPDEEAMTNEDVEEMTQKVVQQAQAEQKGGEQKAAQKPEVAQNMAPSAAEETKPVAKAESRNVASANAVKPIVKEPLPEESEMPKAAAPQAKPAKTAKVDLKPVQEAARRIASNETPSLPTKKVESRVPSSLPKSVGSAKDSEYTVQVASYPSLEEAKSQANTLVGKGFPAYPVEAKVKGKTWYRVSVGSFKSMKEASSYRADLMKQASISSAIVQKIEH